MQDPDTTAYYHIAYGPHAIMNPISDDRFLFLVRHCLAPGARRALDIGSGKGHAALLLTDHCALHVEQVDISAQWTAEAAALFTARGLADRTTIHCMDAALYEASIGSFDLIVCLGTAAIHGDVTRALAALVPALSPDGILLLGEATIDATIPRRYEQHLAEQGWHVPSSRDLLEAFDAASLELVMAMRSTHDEWDRYMSLQWKAVSDHARAHPDDEQAHEFLDTARDEQELYLRYQRRFMDWTVFALRPL